MGYFSDLRQRSASELCLGGAIIFLFVTRQKVKANQTPSAANELSMERGECEPSTHVDSLQVDTHDPE